MSPNSQKKQIAVALYRRDPISTDPVMRKLYKHAAYHWGIVIRQGEVFDSYDVTDRNEIDPVTFRQENPTLDWWFRNEKGVGPSRGGLCLGQIVIGTVPASQSRNDVKEFLMEVPLPQRHQHPQQDCVTWVRNAIRKVHGAQWADDFNIDDFMDWSLSYGDERLSKRGGTSEVVHYEKK